jgi:putative transposase
LSLRIPKLRQGSYFPPFLEPRVPRLRGGRLYDLLEERTHDGRKFRMLNIIDEFTHECLAIRVSRRLKSIDVIDVISDLFILRGVPEHIRSDNGPEFVATAVQEWVGAVGAKSFNARLRDELLNSEIFYTLREAQIVIESWRRHYNTVRPHASIGYRAPAPEVFVPALAAWPAAQPRPAPPAMLPLVPRPTLN